MSFGREVVAEWEDCGRRVARRRRKKTNELRFLAPTRQTFVVSAVEQESKDKDRLIRFECPAPTTRRTGSGVNAKRLHILLHSGK